MQWRKERIEINITTKSKLVLKNCYLLQRMIRRLQSNFQYLKVEIHMEGQLYWYFKSLNSFLSTLTYFAEKEAGFDSFEFAVFKAPQDKSGKLVRYSIEFSHCLIHTFSLLRWGLPPASPPPWRAVRQPIARCRARVTREFSHFIWDYLNLMFFISDFTKGWKPFSC